MPHIDNHVPHLPARQHRGPGRHGEPTAFVLDAIAQGDKEFRIAQLLHGCEIAVIGGLVANTRHVVVVVAFSLPAMTVVTQALINALTTQNCPARSQTFRIGTDRERHPWGAVV